MWGCFQSKQILCTAVTGNAKTSGVRGLSGFSRFFCLGHPVLDERTQRLSIANQVLLRATYTWPNPWTKGSDAVPDEVPVFARCFHLSTSGASSPVLMASSAAMAAVPYPHESYLNCTAMVYVVRSNTHDAEATHGKEHQGALSCTRRDLTPVK